MLAPLAWPTHNPYLAFNTDRLVIFSHINVVDAAHYPVLRRQQQNMDMEIKWPHPELKLDPNHHMFGISIQPRQLIVDTNNINILLIWSS